MPHKEILNHADLLAVTTDRILELLGFGDFPDNQADPVTLTGELESRSRWIKTQQLALPGLTTEVMALHHLLYLTSIGRIEVLDDNPAEGSVLVRLRLGDLLPPCIGNRS